MAIISVRLLFLMKISGNPSRRRRESYDECLSRMRCLGGEPTSPVSARVEQLEDDLARALLLIHTLTQACIRKGVFTRAEIAQTAAEVDLLDGVADGKLDPAVVRPKGTQ